MPDSEKSINIIFDENKIVDALLILNNISVKKNEINSLNQDEIYKLAIHIMYKSCIKIMDSLRNSKMNDDIIQEFISRSNLKYLIRALH